MPPIVTTSTHNLTHQIERETAKFAMYMGIRLAKPIKTGCSILSPSKKRLHKKT
jgi:hypothetical protein